MTPTPSLRIKEKKIKVIVPKSLYRLGVETWGIGYMRKWFLINRNVKLK